MIPDAARYDFSELAASYDAWYASARGRLCDAHALPFADRSFHVATAITTLEFVRDAEAVVGEMVRCTRQGGTVLVGVLNAEARWNRKRKASKANPYADARFFSLPEVRDLLAPYGRPRVAVAAFATRWTGPRRLSLLYDRLAARLGARGGAFLVGRVDR